jgi:hypothetical protein
MKKKRKRKVTRKPSRQQTRGVNRTAREAEVRSCIHSREETSTRSESKCDDDCSVWSCSRWRSREPEAERREAHPLASPEVVGTTYDKSHTTIRAASDFALHLVRFYALHPHCPRDHFVSALMELWGSTRS